MEIKGIDVSAWQGQIDWDAVANYGIDFVLLRITEAGNVIDSCFEKNFSGCQKHNIPVGVYKYSYAMTIAELQIAFDHLCMCCLISGHDLKPAV